MNGASGVDGAELAYEFARCVDEGGVVVFPADTVYGLACDPQNELAVERLYLLKRRARGKAAAVMFFALDAALEAFPELGARTREALERLLPGPVTLLLANPDGRFPLACGDDLATIGLRVPVVDELESVRRPVLQSSANRSGGRDPRRLEEVPVLLRAAADLVIERGELPGTPSTVVDLRGYEDAGSWSVARQGAVPEAAVQDALEGEFHFHPGTYLDDIRAEVPGYDRLQEELIAASGEGAERILELGVGTGETTLRLLARHARASLVGVDESEAMLAGARAALSAERVELRVVRLQDPLPAGPFDLVASALAVHHLDDREKADLFKRIEAVLVPGARFVLADVVVPENPGDAVIPLTPGFDRPSPLGEQLEWLRDAGFSARVTFAHRDLAVILALAAA